MNEYLAYIAATIWDHAGALADHGDDPNLGPAALGQVPLYAAALSDRPEVARMLD